MCDGFLQGWLEQGDPPLYASAKGKKQVLDILLLAACRSIWEEAKNG
jgi:hypothetical protein